MRVLLAASQVGQLDARAAAAALRAGWMEGNPDAQVSEVLCSAGDVDLLDALEAAHGGTRDVVPVLDPAGRHAHPGMLLLVAGTAYVQAADVLPAAPDVGDATRGERESLLLAEHGSSYGVGQLIGAALDSGARRVVIGAGSAATLDLGAGMLTALASRPFAPFDPVAAIDSLPDLVRQARLRLDRAELVLAAAERTTVRGLRGAAAVLQLAIGREQAQRLDARLADLVEALVGLQPERRHLTSAPSAAELARTPGAGVAGGIGLSVTALGGRTVPGPAFVAAEIGLPARVSGVDLVVSLSDRVDAVEADAGVLGAVAVCAAVEGVAVLGLGRVGRLDRRAAAPYGISASAAVEPGVEGLRLAGKRQAAAWRW